MRCLITLLCALLFALVLAAAPAEASRSIDFNSSWLFKSGVGTEAIEPGFDDSHWQELDLPHDFSAAADFSPTNASATGYLPGGVGWYRKHFVLPTETNTKRVLIEFDGVQRNSDVWINGIDLGHRPYGYISFRYDLTPHLRPAGQTNVIAVRAERENVADSRWYPGTGIYRNVKLTVVNPVHIAPHGVFVTTPADTTTQCH
jgi:beta-galactosidase/beta-glucuronidase